jgi:Tol biopolymer transport system component
MQRIATTTVRFKGQTIAEVQNRPLSPGTTFSWAPAPKGALAFVNQKKRLVILDREGRKVEVPGTADVFLPAWSPDGSKIAYLQKIEKKKYALTVLEIK